MFSHSHMSHNTFIDMYSSYSSTFDYRPDVLFLDSKSVDDLRKTYFGERLGDNVVFYRFFLEGIIDNLDQYPMLVDYPDRLIVSNVQSHFPLIAIIWSGSTNNEFVICKTKISEEISSALKLKKFTTLSDLKVKINHMESIPYSCLVWSSTINTPELKKMIENQYTLPAEYRQLHDLLCDDTIRYTANQSVLILDFRRPHLKGSEYVDLKNHQKFFFGNARKSYLERKSEVRDLKKYYFNFCRQFDFSNVEKIAFECHKFDLTATNSSWIEYRENQLRLLKDAKSVFDLSDAMVVKRFPSIEDLNKEIKMALLYKKELIELHQKLKLEYDRKMLIHMLNDPESFPSL